MNYTSNGNNVAICKENTRTQEPGGGVSGGSCPLNFETVVALSHIFYLRTFSLFKIVTTFIKICFVDGSCKRRRFIALS